MKKITLALLMTLCLSTSKATEDIHVEMPPPFFLKNQVDWMNDPCSNGINTIVFPVVKLRRYTSLEVGNPDLLRSDYKAFAYLFPDHRDINDALPYYLLSREKKNAISVLRNLEHGTQFERERLEQDN